MTYHFLTPSSFWTPPLLFNREKFCFENFRCRLLTSIFWKIVQFWLRKSTLTLWTPKTLWPPAPPPRWGEGLSSILDFYRTLSWVLEICLWQVVVLLSSIKCHCQIENRWKTRWCWAATSLGFWVLAGSQTPHSGGSGVRVLSILFSGFALFLLSWSTRCLFSGFALFSR